MKLFKCKYFVLLRGSAVYKGVTRLLSSRSAFDNGDCGNSGKGPFSCRRVDSIMPPVVCVTLLANTKQNVNQVSDVVRKWQSVDRRHNRTPDWWGESDKYCGWKEFINRRWLSWDVAACNLVEKDRRFRGANCFHCYVSSV
jgi:hypothetical protein